VCAGFEDCLTTVLLQVDGADVSFQSMLVTVGEGLDGKRPVQSQKRPEGFIWEYCPNSPNSDSLSSLLMNGNEEGIESCKRCKNSGKAVPRLDIQ
jgi:hypothetical protein